MGTAETGSPRDTDQQAEGTQQPSAEQRKADEERAAMKGCIWIVGMVAIAAVAIAVIATSSRPGEDPPPEAAVPAPTFSWSPPSWLLGYWSSSDNEVQAAAEPGLLDTTLVGDGSVASATIQEWSDERGDVFSIVHSAQGTINRREWGNTSRELMDGGLVYVAKAFSDDGVLMVSMQFRYAGQNAVEAILTIDEAQHAVTLRRDE